MKGVAPVKLAVEVLVVLLESAQAGSLQALCWRLVVLLKMAEVAVEEAGDKKPPMLVVFTPAACP